MTSNHVSCELVTSSAISPRHNLWSCDQPLRAGRNNLTYWALCICGNAPCRIRVPCLCLSTCWTRSNRTCPRAQIPTPDCHLATPATAHCCTSLQHRAHNSSLSCARLCSFVLLVHYSLLAIRTKLHAIHITFTVLWANEMSFKTRGGLISSDIIPHKGTGFYSPLRSHGHLYFKKPTFCTKIHFKTFTYLKQIN
jgi:hypothetical protein